MRVRPHLVFVLVLFSVLSCLVAACGSSDGGSTFIPGADEAGPDGTGLNGDFGDGGGPGFGHCKPRTCQELGAECGPQGDGCGGIIQCGTCTAPQTCGGGGQPSKCGGNFGPGGCTPRTCQQLGINCGPAGDGCGGVIPSCGTCTAPEICGGGGVPSVCGGGSVTTDGGACVPRTCQQQGVTCGPASDGCGGVTANCGTCTAPQTCGGGGVPSQCGGTFGCVPKTCQQLGIGCGLAGDGCGGIINCGGCNAPEICGGGGVPSQCGGGSVTTDGGACVPRTCQQAGANCGQVADGCGGLTPDCGTCTAPQICGGGGVPNVCGGGTAPDGGPICTPRTCQQAGANCGQVADGCGGLTPSCGTCTPPQTCGGGGIPNVCGGGVPTSPDGGTCTPMTCQQAGANCGQVADGCGGLTPDCGTCTAPQICGGGGIPNVCGGGTAPDGGPICTPLTCQQVGATCGQVADGCGGLTPSCGVCTPPAICGGGGYSRCGYGDAGADAAACTGLCLQRVSCDGGPLTSVSGRVYAPGGPNSPYGALPVPGATVYVPNGPVAAFTPGVSCTQCATASGNPLISTTTAADGTFTLSDMPVGTNIPLVIQLGRWRRQITISNVPACQNTVLPGTLTRLPATQAEGDIPLIAISTGRVDGLECVLRKMGVADSEFTNSTGSGRIRLYQDNGARCGNDGGASACSGNFTGALNAAGLYGSTTELGKFDAVIFGCVASEVRKSTAAQQNVVAYANAGGRVFATHYSYVWLFGQENPNDNSYVNPWAATATWNIGHHATNAARVFNIDTSFGKGAQFAQWLNTSLVNALSPNTTSTSSGLPLPAQPRVSISEHRHDVDSATSPAQRWLYATTSDPPTNGTPPGPGENMTLHYTFNTPWGQPQQNQCGRVIFSDFHVTTNSSTTDVRFPAECDNNPLTAQEKILAFMLFDLTTCITPDNPPPVPTCTPTTCQAQNIQCGPAGDGCGGTLNCGTCPNGQSCGGGGTPFVCGGPTCTPRTCQQQGANCGQVGDGCGGTLDCGTCPQGQTCGGGGIANQCGSPSCTPLTCQQQGIQCGIAGDGCGNTINCGTCPQGQTCGGGGTPFVCGGPTCTPTTCQAQGANCGLIGNGCGGVLDCGTCPQGQTCGGGGAPNVCGAASCSPRSCTSPTNIQCGPYSNGCGGILDCGPCPNGQACQNNVCVSNPCTPRTCQQAGATCGSIADGCGGAIDCGTCPQGQTCGGGGTPNVCGAPGCTPRTCQQANATCGPVADGCGGLRDCGPCPPGQQCLNNQCVSNPCVPRTCQQAGANCGPIGDGCGNLIDCGPCPPGQTCGGGGVPNQCGGSEPPR